MNQGLLERPENRQRHQIRPEQLSSELMRRLPLEFLKRQRAIPILLEKDEPAVALADPLNIEAYDAIVGILGRPCRRIVCPTPPRSSRPSAAATTSAPAKRATTSRPTVPEDRRQETAPAAGRLQHRPDPGGGPAQHRRQGPGDQAGQQDPVPRGPQPGQRYPHRALRAGGEDPLPRRRRPAEHPDACPRSRWPRSSRG